MADAFVRINKRRLKMHTRAICYYVAAVVLVCCWVLPVQMWNDLRYEWRVLTGRQKRINRLHPD